ncbi:hypothetical protein K466DRAFT_585520 [Polyporus arcularius HHB13444]|uniref:LIM zinc-binding domain-containing protein n=1 Tax=Polyporus arcularius HHB13444 TaxID=1314778 RepID=A0A5C3PQV5_9APHY|nr:hypothetical protein K466DRAFT_585520 [Polyporus arcularius HHB13444]
MAQSGYSTYYPQAAYAYPPSQPQTQAYDPRLQQQYAAQYQHGPYTQPPPQQPYPYTHSPQRPPSRIDPVQYSSGQPNGPLSSPLPQQPQYGQYYPPRSPQPYNHPPATNPYPSPVSPQTPHSGTPQPGRRPLPDPRGLPPAAANGHGYAPQHTPSPGPYPGSHRPTQSVPTFPVDPPPNALSRIPSGQGASPTSSAFSTTSASPPRPLPLPRSVGSFDLASSRSQPEVQPQSPPKRALPEPHPSPTREQPVRSPEPLPAQGQKFVPLWRRALPQPGGSTTSSQAQAPMERRSTVSGTGRPLPSPGQTSTAVVTPKDPLVRTGTLPPHLQLQHVPSTPQLSQPSQTPIQPPNPPARAPRPVATPSSATNPPVSRFSARERSRTLPMPTAAPSYPLPPQPANAQAQPLSGQPISESPISSDDEELTNALLERHQRSPSPQFGIRDLPSRNTQSNYAGGEVDTTPRARRELPSPDPPSPVEGDSSLAMRMAAVSLRSTSPSSTFRPTHGHSHSLSSANGSRPMPQPPAAQPKQQQGGWPAALPPLPRAPISPTPLSAPPTQSTFAQMQARSLPQPTRSNTSAVSSMPFSRPRSPRKGDLDLSLDDAPPPSLRRSPAPPSSFSQSPSRTPAPSNGHLPHPPPLSSRSQTAPSSTALQRTPSDATSVFSLSKFPTPPKHEPASPSKTAFRPPSPAKSSPRPPSPAKPQFPARAHSPVKFQPPASAREQSQSTPRIPKISFPASADGDSDEDDMDGGPVINICGPGESRGGASPSVPRISFGDDDGLPSINVGGADDGPAIPQISLPGEPSSASPKKHQAQTRKMQETLSNPRLEAAKRSGLVCGGCGGPIIGRIVSAMDMRWHPGCFRCCVCDELLENLSSYAHDGRPYCHLDYHEQFAPRCYHCETAIVDERFITLDDPELGKRTYHEQHFFCAECGDPFLPPSIPGAPSRTFAGDGAFTASADDDVGFTVYKGHPYCEACHVRLRMPKCKKCKKSIRDGMQAVEALGGKWCWECFTCASCDQPFENPAFFQRDGKPFCERCFSIMIRNEI